MTRVTRREVLLTAAAVLAAAVVLAAFVLVRGDAAIGPLAARPSPSASSSAAATSLGTARQLARASVAASDGVRVSASASPTAVPAPSLAEVSPTRTPRPTDGPTFPPGWQGTLPPATPTPSPAPGFWRLEGAIVDPSGSPVSGVCVAIGPHGCQATSPRSDDRGVYVVDFPQANVVYDLHFFHDGFQTADRSLHPVGPTRLDVLLVPN